MKLTDLTKEEIAAVLRGRNQPVPADEPDPDPEDGPMFSAEQVDVLRCIDALTVALELYIPPGSLLQTRLIQSQYLLQMYAGIPVRAEDKPEEEEEPVEEPDKDEAYTVG